MIVDAIRQLLDDSIKWCDPPAEKCYLDWT